MDKFYQWLAFRLPKRLAYWCYIRIHSYATVTKFKDKIPDEVTWHQALEAWK